MLFDVFRHRAHHATELPAIKPTVAEILAEPDSLTFSPGRLRPRLPGLRLRGDPRLRARTSPSSRRCTAGRWCCTTSTRGTGPQTRLTAVGELRDDDFVVVFHPRNREVLDFIRRVTPAGRPGARRAGGPRPRWRPAAGPPVPAGPRARAVRGAAADRGAGRRQGRAACAPTTTSSATPPTAGRR